MSIERERASAAHTTTPGGAPLAVVVERASPPVELCERLQAVWRQHPLDRRAVIEALVTCARWLRDGGLPPELVLLGIKELLPVDVTSTMDRRLASLDARSALLRLTLAVFDGDDDPDSLLAQWPDVDRRAGRPHPAREHARVVRDADGDDWMVYERVDRRALPPRARSLIFESERCVRRVHEYPPSWRELSGRDLLRLVQPPGAG